MTPNMMEPFGITERYGGTAGDETGSIDRSLITSLLQDEIAGILFGMLLQKMHSMQTTGETEVFSS